MDRELDFIIGEDKILADLLDEAEVMMLLDGVLRAGACGAEVVDSKKLLATCGEKTACAAIRVIFLEGEPSGTVSVYAKDSAARVEGLADMLHTALQTLINGAMKRMLTSEAHTTIVNQSYEELLESNERLKASEQQFRELAATLEIKVQERTLELNRLYATMLQKEKLAAVGGLAAGMAHEINNPIGFVISNLHTLTKYAAKLKEMLEFCRVTCEPALPEHFAIQVESLWEKLKIGFVLTDIDALVAQSLNGAERVQKLVADLKGFSHVDGTGVLLTDINLELEQTLSVLSHEVRSGTIIDLNLESVPKVLLKPALLSQAFLHIIQNALQLETTDLKIAISTGQQGKNVLVRIADNGPGIPRVIRDRIFEPFFTTKDVGQGTGMGLTLAQQAIQACSGTIEITCPPAGGTVVTLSLPFEGEQ
jgi:signal transduction histidine kinase